MIDASPDEPDGHLHRRGTWASVSELADGSVATSRRLDAGQQLTFGREQTADVRFPDERRLSRIAGTIRGLAEGVAITNLSATHDVHVQTDSGTTQLRAIVAGQPVASLLLTAGSALVTWPGSELASIRIEVDGRRRPTDQDRVAQGPTTFHPLTLNPATKEFAVALLLCHPRLRGVVGATATPSVPDLTRQVLVTMSSFAVLNEFDTDKVCRARHTARTHEHLKNLRDKLVRAELAPPGASLSPERIAETLVVHSVVRARDLGLLQDPEWLTRQEQEWER